MSIQIITPEVYLDEKLKSTIYLAGPVTKKDNWQDEAIDIINSYHNMSSKTLYILNPNSQKLDTKQNYKSQREWEWYHQKVASKNGAIMFWFPENAEITDIKEDKLLESFLDIGYWTKAKDHNSKLKLSIGWDIQFYRNEMLMHYVNLNNHKLNPKDTLEDTCVHALESIFRKY